MAEGDTSLCAGAGGIFDFFCKKCIDVGKPIVQAEEFCVDCGEYLCMSCYSGHQKTSSTWHHVLQDKPSIPKDMLCSRTRAHTDNITATKLADIDVSSVGDEKRCWITGSAAMNDNTFLIADRNNNTLKLIDINTNIITTTLDLPTNPWDLAAINQHRMVVTFPRNKKILVVNVTDTLVEEGEITVRGECRGVEYCRVRLLVVYNDSPRLEIMDMFWTLSRTIEKASDDRQLFHWPQYVCVSRDGETVYVSDYSRHTVTSLTLDGEVNAVYKDNELSFPTKVCTDHHGNVYVCGLGSGNVHMLTADLRKVKVILTQADGLDRCVWSVSHCQDTHRLFIGMESNTVTSYHLS